MTSSPRTLIVFGTNRTSIILARSIAEDTGREVAAYTVNRAYLGDGVFDGRPVVAFEDLADAFKPSECDVILALGHRRMNQFRRERLEQVKAMGFAVASWVSARAIVPKDFEVRGNVIVHEGVIVQHFAEVGHNVTLRSGVNLGHHAVVEDHSFIASGAVTGGRVHIGEHSWIGLGAVIRDRVRIAPRTFIGAGAVVVADTEPDGVYVGVPARRLEGKTSLELTQ